MGKLFEEAVVQHPGKSGFTIIRYGRPAFTARITLTELAEKSLDLQYYIWEPETTFGQRFMSGFIMMLPVVILFLLLQRRFIEGLTQGGLKA